MSGKQVVKFRKVIADYVTKVAMRMADNEAAGGELMAGDIAKVARDVIKEELDGAYNYEELGLPETKE